MNTDSTYTNTHPYTNPEAYEVLQTDLRYASRVYILAFKVQGKFFVETFGEQAQSGGVTILADHQNTLVLQNLKREFPKLDAWVWHQNRMMHAKIICLPDIGATWIGSHNLTKYSWTVNYNLSVRIDKPSFALRTQRQIEEKISKSLPVYPG
jgi:phosphatidylserine/phosphatidylglycerophosphate/cardiolipin synthase-like enzyme